VQPRWFIEGLAVLEETERSSAGRLRSSLFDMYLRSHVLEGKFLRLDQVANQTRLFPRGNVPYLYGSAFLRFIMRTFGHDALKQVVAQIRRLLVAGLLGAVGDESLAQSGDGAYVWTAVRGVWARTCKRRYQAQAAEVALSPLGMTHERPLSDWKVDRRSSDFCLTRMASRCCG
jgi:hypothetical protein